jgi:hypothetical protein
MAEARRMRALLPRCGRPLAAYPTTRVRRAFRRPWLPDPPRAGLGASIGAALHGGRGRRPRRPRERARASPEAARARGLRTAGSPGRS